MKESNNFNLLKIRNFIFQNGRLLERKLFSYFFGEGREEDVLITLAAYQNEDGGFGNGIEPDLLCPDSTAIGAETALYLLDLLESKEHQVAQNLIKWIFKKQNLQGFIDHPPKHMLDYPHQPWWENPDDNRIFAIAGYLEKWGVKNVEFFKNVRSYYKKVEFPSDISFYHYPFFAYLKFCGQGKADEQKLASLVGKIPSILESNHDHFPLFSRYWFYAIGHVSSRLLKHEADYLISCFQEDGGLKTAYQNLPWWRPIFSLDSLILLKKNKLM